MVEPMDADEKEICIYLRGAPGEFLSISAISRRAGGKRKYRQDPNWAVPVLGRLIEKGFVEADATGHYRLRLVSKRDLQKKRWVSPHVRRILEKSGKQFDGVHEI